MIFTIDNSIRWVFQGANRHQLWSHHSGRDGHKQAKVSLQILPSHNLLKNWQWMNAVQQRDSVDTFERNAPHFAYVPVK